MFRLSRNLFFSTILIIFLFASIISFSQTETVTDGKYTYQIVKNDPFKARIYKLENGLTVYLSVYKDKPRIQTIIGVRAGSKNDPPDATGLAHYLEHLLFKGTDKIGTTDFNQEKIYLDKITELFEEYRKATDPALRKKIYHDIDSLSQIASGYAISNEYDKMMALIGAKGTNASTGFEQTVYTEDIPSNQLQRWAEIEAERFRNPVLRLFHTELETVYEEKNMSLDRDDDKADEMLFSNLFKKHPYGTQTTIGTIEHLKNPSIKKVYDFFNTYYVPNNMSICLSGDFDIDETIKLIDEKFGSFKPKEVPEFIPPEEEPITSPVVKEVYGQESEFLYMAYRFSGIGSRDSRIAELIGSLLYNGSAGLFDLNLTQKQQVLSAVCFSYILKDYSVLYIYGKPREGQTLDEVKNQLLSQIESLKKGEFPDWMLKAIINNKKLRTTKVLEDNSSRAYFMMNSFAKGISWDDAVNSVDKLTEISKEEIVRFADENMKDNYIIVYKKMGDDKTVQKIEKPEITPVEMNIKDKSAFYNEISAGKTQEIKPVFIDFKKDIQKYTLKEKVPVYYLKNNENNTFNLYYVWEMGNNSDNKIGLAVNYLQYLGTSEYTLNQLKQEFYKIACNFGVSVTNDRINVNLSGLSQNLEQALELFESLLNDPVEDRTALDNLVKDILKVRADNKLSQDVIFRNLYSYAVYGPKSPATDIIQENELKAIKPAELTGIIKNLKSYKHKILFYGPEEPDKILGYLDKNHNIPAELKESIPEKKYTEQPTTENNVYFVHYKDKLQMDIMTISREEKFNRDESSYISLYNEYFGYNIVFQELREARGLAYSTYANYTTPSRKDRYHFMTSYIGTQADKIKEGLDGLLGLLNNMPVNEILFSAARDNLLQRLQTDRITKTNILFTLLNLEILGIDYDTRIDLYNKIPGLSLSDIEQFQKSKVRGNKHSVIITGDKDKVNSKLLEDYGEIHFLSLEEIFGY